MPQPLVRTDTACEDVLATTRRYFRNVEGELEDHSSMLAWLARVQSPGGKTGVRARSGARKWSTGVACLALLDQTLLVRARKAVGCMVLECYKVRHRVCGKCGFALFLSLIAHAD